MAFVAIVGASGLSPAEQTRAEIAIRLREAEFGPDEIERALQLYDQLLAYQRNGVGAEALAEALADSRAEPWFTAAEDFPDEVYPPDEYDWWRGVMDFKPYRAWSGVAVPVLLVKGEHDRNSAPAAMEHRIRRALASGGNDRLTVRMFPQADHLLLEWPRGDGQPPPRFADGYLGTLVSWIRATAAGSS